MESRNPYRYLVVFLIFLLAVYLLYKLIEPVITIFLAAVLITYISYPLYKRLSRWIKTEWIARILTIIVIILVLVIPMAYLVVQIRAQTLTIYHTITQNIENDAVTGIECRDMSSELCLLIDKLEEFSARNLANINFSQYLGQGIERLLNITTTYLLKIPQAIVGATLTLFIVYFLLKDGNALYHRVMNWLPLSKKTTRDIVQRFEKITHNIIFAQLFVALVQGIIGMIGFYIFGVPNPIFWGLVMAFAALIPFVGATIIWVPAALLLMLSGYLTGNPAKIWLGLGLIAYGILVISTIDNILRVRILDKRADIHPLIVIIGVVGGVSLFGIMGLFLGPIVFTLLITFFDNFKEQLL